MEPIENDDQVVSLSGKLCIHDATNHHQALIAAIQPDRAVHLDLTAVTACDTAGIQLLYATINALGARNVACKLINVPEAVHAAFSQAGAALPTEN